MSTRRQRGAPPNSGLRKRPGALRVRALPSSPLALAVAAALYPGAYAFAQAAADSAKGKPDELQEVVVTATRRELNLQDVAQSITAFSSADIQKYGIQDLEDVVAALPSLTLVSAMPGQNSIVMRGISTGTAEYRTDSQVAVYLDDQPLTSISQQVDIKPIDIERIESLPGPQGTLFGSSSQAGTLRYITNKPDTSRFSGQLDIQGGKIKGGEEDYEASGHINIPVSDKIAVRAVGFYSHEGGYIDNVLGPTFLDPNVTNADFVKKNWNGYDVYGGRIAARWQISPDWETTASIITQQSSADGSWQSDPALGDYKITRFFDEFRDDDWLQYSLNLKGNLGFAELSVTGSYFDRDIKYAADNMNYDQWRSTYYGPDNLYDTGTAFGQYYNDQRQNRTTYEVRLTSLGESRFQWMAGAFHEKVDDWWDAGTRIPDLVGTPAWDAAQSYACAAYGAYDTPCPLADTDVYYSNIYDKTVKQTALFGEVTWKFTDRWSVTGGARWFEYDRHEIDSYQIPRGLPILYDPDDGTFVLARNESKGKSSDMVYKFGTEYHFDDDRMLYLLYSQGFRLGGRNSARAARTGAVPFEYDPDKVNNYEMGLKSQWLEKRLQLNVSLFLMRWDDIQLNETTGVYWKRGTFNGGKAEQKGVEINGSWNISPNLSIESSVFLADPEFSDTTVFPNGGELHKGDPMPASPKRKYWVSTDYTIPHFLGLNGDSWVRWSWNWQSKTWRDTESIIAKDRDFFTGPWSTSSLQLGFSHENRWDVALIVRNLFDKKGIDYQSDTDYGALFGDPRYRYVRTLQEPRTVSLSLTRKW